MIEKGKCANYEGNYVDFKQHDRVFGQVVGDFNRLTE